MTAPKNALRQRRHSTAEDLPRQLAAWFEGQSRTEDQSKVPWSALVFPDYVLLPERWEIWKAAHPDAKPPAGYEWLNDPNSEGYRQPDWLLEQARRCANRGRR